MKLSVIVPVYNVSSYLPRCIDSLINQTYNRIEIILVDDGSTDNSGKICDAFATEDTRIRVFHKANGGLSEARNFGLSKSKGQYIAFIDSDDYLHSHTFEWMMIILQKEGAEVAACQFKYIQAHQNAQDELQCSGDTTILTGREAVAGLYGPQSRTIQFTACNKIYKKSLFIDHSIEFPVGKIHEDMYTTYKVLFHANKVVILPEQLYYYRQHISSITGVAFSKKNFTLFDATASAITFFQQHQEEHLVRLAIENHLRTLTKIYVKLFNSKDTKKLAKEILKIFESSVTEIPRNQINFKSNVRIILFKYFPKQTATLLRIKENHVNE